MEGIPRGRRLEHWLKNMRGTCKERTDFILSRIKILMTKNFDLFCAARNHPQLLPQAIDIHLPQSMMLPRY